MKILLFSWFNIYKKKQPINTIHSKAYIKTERKCYRYAKSLQKHDDLGSIRCNGRIGFNPCIKFKNAQKGFTFSEKCIFQSIRHGAGYERHGKQMIRRGDVSPASHLFIRQPDKIAFQYPHYNLIIELSVYACRLPCSALAAEAAFEIAFDRPLIVLIYL